MAKEEMDLDSTEKSPKKKLILIIGGVIGLLVVIGGSVGVTLMMVESEGQQSAEATAAKALPKDALYIPVKTMTVNFADAGTGPAQFLQIDISFMTYEAEVIDLVMAHMPIIRNDMLNLLGTQGYKDISTVEGKEALRSNLLLIVQRILKEQEEREGIETLYFTKIIMQ